MILHILFTVLKIIGLVLLCIVLFILLLLIFVLFVPIRYRVSGSIRNGADIKGSVSWLLHIVHLSAAYRGDKPIVCLRIFGIALQLGKHGKTDKQKRRGIRKQKERAEDTAETEIQAFLAETATGEKTPAPKEPAQNTEESKEVGKAAAAGASDTAESTGTEGRPADENEADGSSAIRKLLKLLAHLPEKIRLMMNMLRQAVQKFTNALHAAKDKTGYVSERIRSVSDWWTQPDTEASWIAVKRELKYQLRHVLPRQYEADICFGTGDPASTGQLLGVLAMLYPFTKDRIRVTPDFEEKRLEGTFDVRGRIRIYKFLLTVVRLITDTHVREAYRTWNARKKRAA